MIKQVGQGVAAFCDSLTSEWPSGNVWQQTPAYPDLQSFLKLPDSIDAVAEQPARQTSRTLCLYYFVPLACDP